MLRHPAPASVRGVVEVKAGGVLSRRVRRLALLKSAVLELRTRENGVVVHRVCVIDAEIDARRSSLQIVIRSGDTRVRLYLPSESRFDVWLRSLRSSSRWKVHNFYTLGEVIATGQFARVHTAVERVSSDVVAVKVISKPKLDANPRVSQFISREARVCRSVEHSSIARVHDVFETPDALYIVMDHYGYTLFDVMASTHVLKESDAARILRDILKGLLYLHQRKIMHRDIKPDNILCSHPLPPLTVAICDFGLSNFTDAHVRARRARRLPVPTHVNEVMHGHSTGALRARRNTLSPLVRPRSASSDSSGSSASSHAALLRGHAENEDDVALRRVRAAAAARARSGLSASTSVAAAAGDVQSQSFSFGAFARLRARARAARRDGRHASSLSASGKRLQHYKDEHSWASGGGRTFASTTEAESSERADSDGLAMQWGMRGGAGAGGMGPGAQATTAGGVGGVMSKEPPSRRERMLEASAYNLDAALFPCAIDGFTLTSAIGTPSYVAPEIVERERYGPPVDVWGAGILLHLMLCGKVPFSGRDSSETLESIRVGKLDLDTDAWADVSAPARNLVAAMLQKDPRKRITVEAALAHAWINDPPNVERAMHPKFVHSPLVGNMHEREI